MIVAQTGHRLPPGDAKTAVAADEFLCTGKVVFDSWVGNFEALHASELGVEPHVILRDRIAREFRSTGVMGGSQNLFGRNPIVANQSIIGSRTI